jgi:phosphocarrier protein FPr
MSAVSSDLTLRAPLAGLVLPLAAAPDEAFASGMLGEGLAIDPAEGVLRAPCAGKVASLHRARHACVIQADNGAEILLHVGVDTVALAGEGFEARVTQGARVEAGDALIVFDPAFVRARAKSGLVMVIVANSETHAVELRARDQVAAGDPIARVAGAGAALSPNPAAAPSTAVERSALSFELPLAHGLHARPAAALARLAKAFPGRVALAAPSGGEADAKSVSALMGLGLRHGDMVTLSTQGAGAAAALDAMVDEIAAGLGETHEETPPAPSPPARSAPAAVPAGAIAGVPAAPGRAAGAMLTWRRPRADLRREGQGESLERARLATARAELAKDLAARAAAPGALGGVFAAHGALLEDPELLAAAEAGLARGLSAQAAWSDAAQALARRFAALPDARLAERAADVVDLERQVLALLSGEDPLARLRALPVGSILAVDELTPSEFASIPAGALAGLAMAQGGPTSHVALLASGAGVPTLVALGPAALAAPDGARAVLDADAGLLRLSPTTAELADVEAETSRRLKARATFGAASGPARTKDGAPIAVLANIGSVEDARRAAREPVEGVGLLRSEFLFMERDRAPDEDEQLADYQAIVDAFDGRPVTARTLDVGGDKPIAYLPLPPEENPALGLRGVRVGLTLRPDLLRAQVRAMLRVKPRGRLKIMVPMIVCLAELRAVRALIEEEAAALGRGGRIELGAMIETPAAAALAGQLAREADFLSIGTNDLTQYTLAMDRGNPALAAQTDALHPAVLTLVALACEGARRHGRPISICGGIAADPVAAPLLVGLGARALSAPASRAADLRAALAQVTIGDCEALARDALKAEAPQEVRALLRSRTSGGTV